MSRRNRRPPPDAAPLALEIADLDHDGRGVARRADGKVVFVDGALPGERVLARLTRSGRDFDQAQVVAVERASPDRVEPRCAHFGTCGGCVLQHLAPDAQIAAKQAQLLDNLKRIGGLVPARVLPPLTGPAWAYRRKARLSVKHVPRKERVLVGFRERQPRFIADLRRCEVLDARVGPLLERLGDLVGTLAIAADVAQVEVAAGDGERPALVFRHLRPLGPEDRALLVDFADREAVAVYLQPGGPSSVQLLHPPGHALHFDLPRHALRVAFEPLDFVQVNAQLNAAMIDQALDLLAPQPHEHVLDLFCGLGNFSLPLARRAGSVTGVEGDAALVARAQANARANGLANVEFHATDLALIDPRAPWLQPPPDAVLVDPPRTGAQALVEALRFDGARRLLYVSCHPGSLARDARLLVERHGWRLAAAGVMDMFPHTAHVESMALFLRP